MTAVRVIATIVFDSAEQCEQAAAAMTRVNQVRQKEEGCLQYELFRSLDDPLKLSLHELWASRALYDKHWQAQCEREGVPDPERLRRGTLEFYSYAEYALIDGIWQPAAQADRMSTIRWA